MTDDAAPPTVRRAAIQAVWTVAIGIIVVLIGNLVIDLIAGHARMTLDYAGGLVLALGLKTVIWAIWIVAIAVRFRDEPPRRRAQLAVGAGLVVAIIDGLIRIISSLGAGHPGSALLAAIPLVVGIVVFAVASALGGYGAIPLSSRDSAAR